MKFSHIVGMIAASTFLVPYILGPVYMISAVVFFAIRPSVGTFLYLLPLILSAIIPPIEMRWLLKTYFYKCMCEYFDYEEIFEISDDEMFRNMDLKKSYLLTGQPHGVLSF